VHRKSSIVLKIDSLQSKVFEKYGRGSGRKCIENPGIPDEVESAEKSMVLNESKQVSTMPALLEVHANHPEGFRRALELEGNHSARLLMTLTKLLDGDKGEQYFEVAKMLIEH
jgi:hypothetical protein